MLNKVNIVKPTNTAIKSKKRKIIKLGDSSNRIT